MCTVSYFIFVDVRYVGYISNIETCKVALLFRIVKFHKQNILSNTHMYIMINASNEGISVEF